MLTFRLTAEICLVSNLPIINYTRLTFHDLTAFNV